MTHVTRLYVPISTRLQTVWRVVMPDGSVSWQCWTACADRNAPYNEMLGTALVLHNDGRAERMTLRPDDTCQMMEVMPNVSKGSDK